MPFGVIVGLGMLLGFAAWGILLMRSKVREKSTEASSYYEQHRHVRRRALGPSNLG
jgi:hypothetical protein